MGDLHGSSAEVLVAKVHVIFLLGQLIHLAELIHVQLTNEGRKVFVPEVMR
jgi:hypothetical protein